MGCRLVSFNRLCHWAHVLSPFVIAFKCKHQ
jgi:hypothetical protein